MSWLTNRTWRELIGDAEADKYKDDPTPIAVDYPMTANLKNTATGTILGFLCRGAIDKVYLKRSLYNWDHLIILYAEKDLNDQPGPNVLGFAGLNTGTTEVYVICVSHLAKGKGYGKMLLDKAEEVMKAAGKSEITLTPINAELRDKVYKPLGYVVVGKNKDNEEVMKKSLVQSLAAGQGSPPPKSYLQALTGRARRTRRRKTRRRRRNSSKV